MKRWMLLLLAVTLAFATTACGFAYQFPWDSSSESAAEEASEPESEPDPPPEPEIPADQDPTKPEGATVEILESFRQWDVEALNSRMPADAQMDLLSWGIPPAFETHLKAISAKMTYTVGEAAVTGDKAVVKATIVSADSTELLNEIVSSAVSYIAKQKLLGKSPEDDPDALLRTVMDSISTENLPMVERKVEVRLFLDSDGAWKLENQGEENLPLFNAVFGGALDLVKQLSAMMSDYGISIQ